MYVYIFYLQFFKYYLDKEFLEYLFLIFVFLINYIYRNVEMQKFYGFFEIYLQINRFMVFKLKIIVVGELELFQFKQINIIFQIVVGILRVFYKIFWRKEQKEYFFIFCFEIIFFGSFRDLIKLLVVFFNIFVFYCLIVRNQRQVSKVYILVFYECDYYLILKGYIMGLVLGLSG